MIVDTHCHVIATDHARYPLASAHAEPAHWATGRPMTAELLVERMDGAGVDRAVVVQAYMAHAYDNSYTADSVARYPDRCVGVCVVDAYTAGAADELSYWVRERGMAGLRFYVDPPTWRSQEQSARFVDEPAVAPVWERARELGISVCVPPLRANRLERAVPLFARYPEIPILLDHLGGLPLTDGPPYAAAKPWFALADLPNVFLKFSPTNLSNAPESDPEAHELFRRLVDVFEPRRLMWGSNVPATDLAYADTLAQARRTVAIFQPDVQAWLLGESACSIYPGLRQGAS